MKLLIVLVATGVALVAAGPRERRQADGCFWWQENSDCGNGNDNSTAPADAPSEISVTPEEEVRTGIEGDRIANTGGQRAPVGNVGSGNDPGNAYCNNNLGLCVPYYLCREGNIVTDGAGLIDIRIGPQRNGNDGSTTSNSECPQFLDVCCNAPETTPITPLPPKQEQRCGVRNEQGVHTRITGFKDNQAQFGEFPWMAAVLRKEYIEDKELNLYVCGGSLIHPQVILTAAHCVHSKDASSLKVRLGEWDTQRTYELYPHIDRNVLQVTIHEGYNSGALYNDFALLFLDSPADIAPNVATVCLPGQGQNFDYQECWATGWGRDQFGKDGEYQNVLKEIALPIVPHGDCQSSLRTTRLGQFFRLHNSFVCAGGRPGLDTCRGDGGSPLVCEVGQNTYVQAGIVAWGIGCGENGIPGVYADVAGASNWITTNADAGLLNLYSIQLQPTYWNGYQG